jgi:hypothetical protein
MSTFTNYDSVAASDYDVARLPIGADIMGKNSILEPKIKLIFRKNHSKKLTG